MHNRVKARLRALEAAALPNEAYTIPVEWVDGDTGAQVGYIAREPIPVGERLTPQLVDYRRGVVGADHGEE